MTTAVTVSQLNTYVRSLLEGDANLNPIFVCGEISNFNNHYSSGHLYMTVKDEKAQIRAVMFRSAAARLRFVPQNGMSVIILGRVSLYDRDGSYQLYIEQMQPDGAGALSIAYEQLKERLAAEGLFDDSRKKSIPEYPRRIAVITSKTGAAVRDIINVLGRRWPLAELVLCGVQVQGDAAPPQLASALCEVNRSRAADVIIIGRGGGSAEELWAFNDERVVRAVAASDIPVISAVGHETDYTLCDFAADLRAPTPSAAAELASPDAAGLEARIRLYADAYTRALRSRLTSAEMRLAGVMTAGCFDSPSDYIGRFFDRVKILGERINSAARAGIERKDASFALAAGRLDLLSPMRTMARGFAAVMRGERQVFSAASLAEGDAVRLIFSDGAAECTVGKTEVNNA